MTLDCEKMKKMLDICKKEIYPNHKKDDNHIAKLYMCILLIEHYKINNCK